GPSAGRAHDRQGAARARRYDPALHPVRMDRARGRRWMVRAPRQIRPAADEKDPRARDPLREGRLPGLTGDRGILGALLRSFPREAGLQRCVRTRRPCPKRGRDLQKPALARTLERLADKGRDAYYKGPIAHAIVEYSKKHGGFFSEKDFAENR